MKNILNKVIYPLAFISASGLALAQDEKYTENWIYGLLCKIVGIGRNILFILSGALIIWAALLFLTSGGVADKIKTARTVLIYAVVAIVLGLLAYGITGFVANLLGEDVPAACS